MNPPDADEVLKWMKTTDVVEVSYKQGAKGFSFSLGGAARPMGASTPVKIPQSNSITVNSPAVGYYHAAGPGKSKSFKVGDRVAKDGVLGYLEAGPKRWEVKCPADGSLAQILIEEGGVAQYGQPLFIVNAE